MSSPQQCGVKNRSSQVTKPDLTYTHCPHSANSFCLLQNKKARFGAQPAQGNNPLVEWEITDWSYLLSLAEREPILHSGFSAFCFLQKLHHTALLLYMGRREREINVTMIWLGYYSIHHLTQKKYDNWVLKGLNIYLFFLTVSSLLGFLTITIHREALLTGQISD